MGALEVDRRPRHDDVRAELKLWFDHGLGDCADWAQALVLWRRRGYDVRVHVEDNKAWLWDACGFERIPIDGAQYVPFGYPPEFNWPIHGELPRNKTAWNMTLPPMPHIGDLETLWSELSDVRLDVRPRIDGAVQAGVDRWLRGLPEPIVLLHTQGTNFAEQKSIPRHVCLALYEGLLDELEGSLVLLDWDDRIPHLPHGRVRHTKRDWGHLDLEQLAALMNRASLVLGVDSGPLHFAALMPNLRALGLWTDHIPWHCILRPNDNTVHLMPQRVEARSVRWPWHLVEWRDPHREATAGPDVRDVVRCARRLLGPPRFVSHQPALDVVLQHVLDRLRSSTSSAPLADRDRTLTRAIDLLASRAAPLVVETGCVRGPDDWGAGCFGYVIGSWLRLRGGGRLISIDNDRSKLAIAADVLRGLDRWVTLVHQDSVRWLEANDDPIDLLYLDSLDVDDPLHAEHCLAEIRAAEHALGARALVLIDDTPWSDGAWRGKGRLAVPWLTGNGWRIVDAGYQVLLARDTNPSP